MLRSSRRQFALALGSLAIACKKGGSSGSLKIAVIPKGTTHEFWKAVHAGAEKAGKEAWDPLESTCRHASLSIL